MKSWWPRPEKGVINKEGQVLQCTKFTLIDVCIECESFGDLIHRLLQSRRIVPLFQSLYVYCAVMQAAAKTCVS